MQSGIRASPKATF